jgi:hypothetical protein
MLGQASDLVGPAPVEVRCCCEPNKIIGWLRMPNPPTRPGTVPVLLRSPDVLASDLPHMVELEAAWLWGAFDRTGDQTRRIAFKDNHMPIETLRLLPGFEENTHADY